MSTLEQEPAETVQTDRRDALVDELRQLEADAWAAYAGAVTRRESAPVRERAFDVALKAMRAVADVQGERPWPVRTNGAH